MMMKTKINYNNAMKVCGIITEYNPFHNGHRYHIEKARAITDCDYLVAVMSGNVCQRGDLSVIDKFTKAKIALENGVDVVIELPFIYACQSADIFARGAIDILKLLQVDDIVFGSEINDIENLKDIANSPINPTHLKEAMDVGMSYPKAYSLLADRLYPNDILAVSYLKELKDSDIKAHTIQRTTAYHDETIAEISSAKAIRKAIHEGKDYSAATPIKVAHPIFLSELYPMIRKRLLLSSSEDLKEIHLVSEGIERMLQKNALKYDKFEDFIKATISKRYTRSRIQRILIWILADIKEKMMPHAQTYVRLLGFKDTARPLIRSYVDKGLPIHSQLKHLPPKQKDIEYRISLLYALAFLDSSFSQKLIKRELQGPVIL